MNGIEGLDNEIAELLNLKDTSKFNGSAACGKKSLFNYSIARFLLINFILTCQQGVHQ